MPELVPIRSFNLKVIFLVHFIFISLSCMGTSAASTYLFYNLIYTLLLIWSIYHEQSHDAIQLAIVVNGCSILLDIIFLIMHFGNLAANISLLKTLKNELDLQYEEIRNTYCLVKGVLTGILSRGHNESYEDIERANLPQDTSNAGGYDFSSAQQI
ncbi:hypothetical protein NQ317_001506 [Molorchus minor]|uniref:Uncharacterized protein n=1 Tax=Molorchus minor TaxID=1323400 RepID=A0ABQ9JWC2_9CUCU|nr:hypothetical protein NQ317_001506 [Molorchus minor]